MPSGKKSPWFKLHISDWKAGVATLTGEQRGVYITLLSHIHEAGGAIPFDIKDLAIQSGISVARLEPVIERLLKEGLIVLRDGMVSNGKPSIAEV